MHPTNVDFLIIGQGLAGSILAFELINKGQHVLVIDNNHIGSSSHVAAGIINPITGHRLNLGNDFMAYYARANKFYVDIENAIGTEVINHIDQTRLIKNAGQADYFAKRLSQSDYDDFLERNDSASLFNDTPFGSAKIKQTSVVDTKLLLGKTREWLKTQNSYLNKAIDYAQLNFNETVIEYEQITAKKIIFCEGYQAINNPWLKNLPFKLAKGEVLTVENLTAEHGMLSWGNWLTPHSNKQAKLGSNYSWRDTELSPTPEVRDKLLASLMQQTSLTPQVFKHEVGIRPTTTNRHAFVGGITGLDNAYCFNGFGSKGCLTIPAHADTLCDHLLNQTALPIEVSQWL